MNLFPAGRGIGRGGAQAPHGRGARPSARLRVRGGQNGHALDVIHPDLPIGLLPTWAWTIASLTSVDQWMPQEHLEVPSPLHGRNRARGTLATTDRKRELRGPDLGPHEAPKANAASLDQRPGPFDVRSSGAQGLILPTVSNDFLTCLYV